MKNPSRTQFIRNFVRLNGLSSEFSSWYFKEGMKVNDLMKWWGKGERKTLHEGLDLLYYLDHRNNIRTLSATTQVPPVIEGEIVKIFPDFIGYSVLFRHTLQQEGYQLFSILAHILPENHIRPGKIINNLARPVGQLAPVNSAQAVPSHLHISIFWYPTSFPARQIDWSVIAAAKQILLVDPLEIF